tara:strand:+ start:68 stop:259 length:192 start_codon:yes stop_codon:yes gene_type:complete
MITVLAASAIYVLEAEIHIWAMVVGKMMGVSALQVSAQRKGFWNARLALTAREMTQGSECQTG